SCLLRRRPPLCCCFFFNSSPTPAVYTLSLHDALPISPVADLDLNFHGLTAADLDTEFNTGTLFIGKDRAPLREIIEALESTYCGHIGAEIMHITPLAEKQWLQQRLESVRSNPQFTKEQRLALLERLTAAEGLEKHLDSKYPGTKRFGLE